MADDTALVQDLLLQLDLETLEDRLFRGVSRNIGGRSVFGGQVAGQALVAANRTVAEELKAHSLHGYFIRPGDMDAAIVYEVDKTRDGRSFATRRVQAIQHGQPIFTMLASFHVQEDGHVHQTPMPEVPAPETLASNDVLRRQWIDEMDRVPESLRESVSRGIALDVRPVDPRNMLDPDRRAPQQEMWFKTRTAIPDDPEMHRAILTYASDFGLLSTALLPHGISYFSSGMKMASLDHALWFHRDPRVDDWLLYSMDSPGAQNARGFSRGLIYDRDGNLVASAAQEGLIRVRH